MRCENCIDIEEQDGVLPLCKTSSPQPSPGGRGRSEAEGEGLFGGCPIPSLSAEEARILEMRGMLMGLKGLVDAGTVLRMHRATLEDLKVLASIEEGLKERNELFRRCGN
ncbi:MAG: hypothetical protein M0Z75_12050 [Nitrospiraceae bacterium]|nr:hypothetical protein [Nitrospiraceae bacterium]